VKAIGKAGHPTSKRVKEGGFIVVYIFAVLRITTFLNKKALGEFKPPPTPFAFPPKRIINIHLSFI